MVKVNFPKNLYAAFFITIVAILPGISVFWMVSISGVQLNWLLYPVLLMISIALILITKKIPIECSLLVAVLCFYGTLAGLYQGNFAYLIRTGFSFLPLTILASYYPSHHSKRIFWIIFLTSLLIPIFLSYCQYMGWLEYYSYDTVDHEEVGRISGGYNKPSGFTVFLFPLYLLGFYFRIHGRRWLGYLIIVFVVLLVHIIGHRTSEFAFLVILLLSFTPKIFGRLLRYYYLLFLNFWTGILLFFFVYLAYQRYGLIEALRGRLPMWMAHSFDYWHESSLREIVLGKQSIMLSSLWNDNIAIWTLDEVHNNPFTVIVFFGLTGYFIYCLFMRRLFLNHYGTNHTWRFIISACFFFHILFSFTNENISYPTIVWPIFAWLFLLKKTDESAC